MGNQNYAVVARSSVSTQVSTSTGVGWLYGITTIADEDPSATISFFGLDQFNPIPSPLPDAATVWLQGVHIAFAQQFQLQDINMGEDPDRILVVAEDKPVAAGTTVAAGGMFCALDVSAGSALLADFLQPAINGVVTANIDTTWMTAAQTIHGTGGGLYTVTTITDATHADLTFTGESSALVKVAA